MSPPTATLGHPVAFVCWVFLIKPKTFSDFCCDFPFEVVPQTRAVQGLPSGLVQVAHVMFLQVRLM